MKITSLMALALSVCVASTGQAQWTSARADGHAPIGVMADHTHEKGEIMLSYRYMYMFMEDSRVGTEKVSDWAVVDPAGPYGYTITPTNMPMQMHMLGLMYAPADIVTLALGVPYIVLGMDHMARNAMTFTTNSSGFGDIKLQGMVQLPEWDRQSIHLNLGMSFPTGSISQMDVTPASAPDEAQLPYPMQTGSGTWDALAGFTYLGQVTSVSWGAQALGTFRLGTNSHDYKLGNKYEGTAWLAYKFLTQVSASFRGLVSRIDNIEGADPALVPLDPVVPTADPLLRAGTRVDLGLGLNTDITSGPFKGLRLAVEGLLPVYQKLDGPQLEVDFTLIAGVQYSMHLY
jgi:hypothetical protein